MDKCLKHKSNVIRILLLLTLTGCGLSLESDDSKSLDESPLQLVEEKGLSSPLVQSEQDEWKTKIEAELL